MKNKNKTKKKMSPILKFLLIVFTIVFTFILIAGMGVMGYISNTVVKDIRPPQTFVDGIAVPAKKETVGEKIIKTFSGVPERTNFLICGVDDEGGGMRTDTMMIGCFNSETKNVSLVAVPRDIEVSIPNDVMKQLNAEGIYPPSYMKFNEVHSYSGKEYGLYALTKVIESTFGVPIDYYVKIDTDAFVEIVDALGGVDMTLTRNYYYYDPTQNLKIDLKAGPQHLSGKDAEGLVRYRADYANADLKRIEVQQEFMRELLKQSLQREKVMNDLPSLISTLIHNVTTNMTIPQATKYLQYIPSLSAENFDTYTIPTGRGYGRDDKSYISLNEEEAEALIEEVFFAAPAQPPKDSKELRIAVLNGSGVSGLAKKTAEELEEKGYTISTIGDYTDSKKENDRIFVKSSGYGEDLKKMFDGSEIISNKNSIPKGADIAIVLGTGNKNNSD